MDNKERRNEMAEGKHAMEKGKKEVYCLFAINIFTYLCSEYIKIREER